MMPFERFPACRLRFLFVALVLAAWTSSPATASIRDHSVHFSRQDSVPKVWVNTGSGVYHCPGTRYYGATKVGIYLTEAQARKRGYRPATNRTCAVQAAAAESNERVWVNTNTGVYHCSGTRYYGKTKAGKYLSEAEARRAGYHPAYGRGCSTR